MRRLFVGLAVVLATVALTAAPAAAHADLDRTEPPGGAVLETAPAKLDVLFTGDVEIPDDSISVYDADAQPVAVGRAQQLDGRKDAVTASVPEMGDGTYVVTWRVLSADSHPIHGAFTFIVGTGTPADAGAVAAGSGPSPAANPQALAQQLLEADAGDSDVGIVFGAVRFASYASLIVFLGGAAFLLTLWPQGGSVRAARRIMGGAWAIAIVMSAAGIAMQGVYGEGRPLGDLFDWSVIEGVLDTRFGQAWLARLVLLVVAGPLLVWALRSHRAKHGGLALLAVIGGAIAATGGIAGHPSTNSPAALAVGIDAAHFAAVSIWLGGLVLLCLVVLRRDDANVAGEVVPRFSKLAFASVAVVALTGTVQGWWQVRTLDALADSTYGRLLITKLALVAGILVLAWFSRAWVRSRAQAPVPALVAAGPGAMTASTPEIRRLRRSVAGEVVIAIAVLAVTAVLVNTVPARTAIAGSDSVDARDAFTGRFDTELHTAQVRIDVGADPARVGPNEIHIYTLTHGGEADDVEELRARISLSANSLGPLEVPLQRVGPGHFAAYAYQIPLPGMWLLEVTVRTSDIDQSNATTPMQIRP